MQQNIIIYGKNGQVGAALKEILSTNLLAIKPLVFASTEYDFSDINNIRNALEKIPAVAIINATAYTDVNKAQSEAELAYKANALIPQALATYCLEKDIILIHYSTDYVFGDKITSPHKETDTTNPLNIYGSSKLAGEQYIQQIGGKYLIFRTSWVYDSQRKNFLTTMLKLAAQNESLNVVNDQFGAPTYAEDLALITIEILQKSLLMQPFPSGIYNICNSGETNWYEFALAIFSEAAKKNIPLKIQEVKPISGSQFPSPATRPYNSRLNCALATEKFNVKMPHWKIGLNKALENIYASRNHTT